MDFSRPSIEGKEIDGGEGIDTVDGDGYYEGHPEVSIREDGEARARLEIVETL